MASFTTASFTKARERPRGHSRTRSGLGGANRRAPPSVVLSSIAAAAPSKAQQEANTNEGIKTGTGKARVRPVPPPSGLKGAFVSVKNPLEAALSAQSSSGKRASSGKFYYARGDRPAPGRGPRNPADKVRKAPPPRHPKPNGTNPHKRGNSRHRIPPPRGLKGAYKNFANPLAVAQDRQKHPKNQLAAAAERKVSHARVKSGRVVPPRPKSRAPGSGVYNIDPNSFGRIRGGSMSKAPTGRLASPSDAAMDKKKANGVETARKKRVNRLRMIKKQNSERQLKVAGLKAGWEMVKDASGKEYYWCRETNETRWEQP